MKKFKWVIEVTVDETWVADGFDPISYSFQDAILSYMLPFAYPEEVKCKILQRPSKSSITKAQGFKIP